MMSVIPNRTTVQIISPGLASSSGLAAWTTLTPASGPETGSVTASAHQEIGHEAHQERVEGDRLGQGEAEEHEAQDLAPELGLTGDRLHGLAHQVAHAGAGADCPEAGRQTELDGLGRLDDVAVKCH